jgi:hypothetical protein
MIISILAAIINGIVFPAIGYVLAMIFSSFDYQNTDQLVK